MAVTIKNIDEMDDTELLAYTDTAGRRLESNNREVHVLQTECYKRYRSSRDYLSRVVKNKGTPQLVSARPFQQVEIIKSLMLGNRPKIFAKFTQDSAAEGERVLQFTNDSLFDKGGINYEFVLEQTENDRVICGTSVQKLWWEREVATRKVRRPISLMGKDLPESFMGMDLTREVNEEYFKVNECMGGHVDPLQFDADPLIPNIKDQSEIRERMTMLYSEIKKKCDSGWFYNWDKVEDLIQGEQEQNEFVIARRDASNTGTYTTPTDDTHDPLIKVNQYWFKPNWVVSVIPGRVVLQKTRHDYGRPPYVVTKFIQYCTDFWGIGMIEPLIPLFDEKNQIRNLRMSAKRRAYGLVAIMNRAYMRNPDADVTPKDFWLWDMKDINKGVRFESPKTNDDLVREEAIVDREIDSEGANPYLAGGGGNPEEAASRTKMVTVASGNKFRRERGNMESGVEEFVEIFCTMNHQHLIENKEFYVPDENGFMVRQWANYSWFDTSEAWFKLVVELGSTRPLNEEEEFKKWSLTYQLVGQDPLANKPTILKNLLNAAGIQDVSQAINDVPMIPLPVVEQMLKEAINKSRDRMMQTEVPRKIETQVPDLLPAAPAANQTVNTGARQ